MSMQQEIAAAFGELQAVFAETATIQGIAGIPVTTGPNVTLSMAYGDGGTNQLQGVTLYYPLFGGTPTPVIDGDVNFRGLDYRIQTIEQHMATWQIAAAQVAGQKGA